MKTEIGYSSQWIKEELQRFKEEEDERREHAYRIEMKKIHSIAVDDTEGERRISIEDVSSMIEEETPKGTFLLYCDMIFVLTIFLAYVGRHLGRILSKVSTE